MKNHALELDDVRRVFIKRWNSMEWLLFSIIHQHLLQYCLLIHHLVRDVGHELLKFFTSLTTWTYSHCWIC